MREMEVDRVCVCVSRSVFRASAHDTSRRREERWEVRGQLVAVYSPTTHLTQEAHGGVAHDAESLVALHLVWVRVKKPGRHVVVHAVYFATNGSQRVVEDLPPVVVLHVW